VTAAAARRGRPSRTAVAAVAACGAAVLALLVGWWVFTPDTPETDSVEAGFARDMSEHHAQAVEMSLTALQTSDERDIDLLAYDIATTQATQIGMMQGWLEQWDLPSARPGPRMAWMGDGPMDSPSTDEATPGSADYRPMPGMATPAEMQRLESASPEEVAVPFLRLMITHHEAGVDMARAAAQTADAPEVTRLAEAMVNGQRSEIELMTRLLEEHEADISP